MEIPENHQEFCKAVGRLCREYKVAQFNGSFRPGYRDPWSGEIAFSWSAGRHEVDTEKINIQSQVSISTTIDAAHLKEGA